jgi:hypothetical protein
MPVRPLDDVKPARTLDLAWKAPGHGGKGNPGFVTG